MAQTSPAVTTLSKKVAEHRMSAHKSKIKRAASPIPLARHSISQSLQTEYGAEVFTFTADLGQGEELEPARKKPRCSASSQVHLHRGPAPGTVR